MTLEFGLLMACIEDPPSRADATAIRRMLLDGVDWSLFARRAIDHGLVGLAAQTLNFVAPDLVPDDIRDAFHANSEQTRQRNGALLQELTGLIEALASDGIEAIPFKAAVLAIEAYSDLALCVIPNIDLLIRDRDVAPSIATLCRLGYERSGRLAAHQRHLLHRLRGLETLVKQTVGTEVDLHTRLTPAKSALNFDHAAFWGRVRFTKLNGRTLATLAPEDHLLTLAVHGGNTLWWNIKSARDFAAFVASHPRLDWDALDERARAQGCRGVLLLAASLARRCFDVLVPEAIAAAASSEPRVEVIASRIVERWRRDEVTGPPDSNKLSVDRLRLHDGVSRQMRYVIRTMLLPEPWHVVAVSLPKGLSFFYFPLKIAHDCVALPLWRIGRQALKQVMYVRDGLRNSARALGLKPDSTARVNQAKHHKALEEANLTLAADPNDAAAWRTLGGALFGLGRYEQAIACYDKALAHTPEIKVIWLERRAAVRASNKAARQAQGDEDTQAFDLLSADGWARRAGFLSVSKRLEEAVAAADRALSIDPRHLTAMRIGIRCRIHACDWRRREDDLRRISEAVSADLNIITPFNHRAVSESAAEALVVARSLWKGLRQSPPLWRGEVYRHKRIRLAYVCRDFHDHPTALLIAGVFEHHDRSRFETVAIALSPDNGSRIRRRIKAAFDRFVEVDGTSDADVATMMRDMEIDIAVDLNNHAGASGILARRPAPVQVSYLASAGTRGAPFIDYLIADRTVIPSEQFRYYSEKIVYLPHSYQCNDSGRRISERTISRIDAELPEKGFVFCCFNNNYKIAPSIFDIWMRLLTACPGSVLWLLFSNPYAMRNLRREASERGVASARLIFAPHMPVDDHLARHRLADLFLDTLPYNAHTTASDALWSGLPMVTCLGKTFPGRVAASLLRAIGLTELITTTLADYEALARALAHDSERLAGVRAKLARNRETQPLFDTAGITRDLETAYTMMWERVQRGEPPDHLSIASASAAARRDPPVWDSSGAIRS